MTVAQKLREAAESLLECAYDCDLAAQTAVTRSDKTRLRYAARVFRSLAHRLKGYVFDLTTVQSSR